MSNNAETSPQTAFCNVSVHIGLLSTNVALINNNKLKILLGLFGHITGEGPTWYVCANGEFWHVSAIVFVVCS